jgi:hypothetical protein
VNSQTQAQEGSPARDRFKLLHKKPPMRSQHYGSDLDFVLVEKYPFPDIVAVLDYKKPADVISFAEVILYNALMVRGLTVYIVTGAPDAGRFHIERYCGGHHEIPSYRLTTICRTESWAEFNNWETELRRLWQEKFRR